MAVGAIQAKAAESPRLRKPRVRLRVLLVAAIVFALTSVAGVQFLKTERAASVGYQQARAQADAAVMTALAQGYSSEDLTRIQSALDADRAQVVPFFLRQTTFYDKRQATVRAVLADLPRVEAEAMSRRKAAAQTGVSDARNVIEAARGQGADNDQLAPLKARLDKVGLALAAASIPNDIAPLVTQASQVVKEASDAGAVAAAEQTQLARAAEALKSQYHDNIDQLRGAGNAAVGPARNDGTIATLLKIGGAGSPVARLEHYASLLPNSDMSQVALGAAGAQSYQKRIHDLLTSQMPSQTIALSLTAQELWAYQDGKVVQDTLITSGRPALPTDVGAMKVLWKQSPWKMHSPWPRSSPYWYPDTQVQKVVWFTVTGEGLHDASWEPDSWYGPGGQLTSAASHGCVHVKMAAENFLYDWAKVGTPVIVYPGDGTPVSEQMRQVTVGANGVPFTGPKGA